MVQRLCKTDSWFQISHEGFLQVQASSGKPKKLKFDELHLPKIYIPPTKALHTEDLSTLISTTCSPNSQIPYVIFGNISHFSLINSSVFFLVKNYILLTKIAHESKFCRSSTVPTRIHQTSHAIFQEKSQFLFKLWITIQFYER